MVNAGDTLPEDFIVFTKLMEVAREAVASLTGTDVDNVKPDDDGEFRCMYGSSGVFVGVKTKPPSLIFAPFCLMKLVKVLPFTHC